MEQEGEQVMLKSSLRGLTAALAALILAGCVAAPAHTSGRVVVQDQNTRVEVVFNDHDRRLIHHYYQERYRHQYQNGRGKKGLPPGLAKREQLPPGLRKQIVRNGHLPPGLETRALPHELERQLSALPEGYVRLRIGSDIVLMDGRSRVILDVVKDIPL